MDLPIGRKIADANALEFVKDEYIYVVYVEAPIALFSW